MNFELRDVIVTKQPAHYLQWQPFNRIYRVIDYCNEKAVIAKDLESGLLHVLNKAEIDKSFMRLDTL